MSRDWTQSVATAALVAVAALSGWLVARSVVLGPPAERPLLAVLAVVLGVVVLRHPRVSPYLGLAAMPLALVLPEPLLVRLLGSLLVALGLLGARPGGDPRRLPAGLLIAAVGASAVFTGFLVAPRTPTQLSVVIAFVHAVVLAVGIAVHGLPVRHLLLVLMGWGLLAGAVLLHHPPGTAERGGDVGLGENANTLGILAALGLVAAGAWLWQRRGDLWTLPVGLVCAAGVLLSGSRGSLLAVLAGGAVLVLHRWFRRSLRTAVLLTLTGSLLALVVAPPLVAAFLHAAGRSVDAGYNLGVREQVLTFSLRQIWEHPVGGIGLDRLSYLTQQSPGLGIAISAHNTFVGYLAACGLLSGGLFVILVLVALVRSRAHAPVALLPLVVTVCAAGLSLEWYPTNVLGPLCFAVLAAAAATPEVSLTLRPESTSPEGGIRTGCTQDPRRR